MEIKHIELSNGGAFVIKRDQQRIAELTYKQDGDTINIDHTEVDKSLRGQGVGEDLLREAVKFARENNLNVTATCPYASKVLGRSDKFSDVYIAE